MQDANITSEGTERGQHPVLTRAQGRPQKASALHEIASCELI